MKKKIIFSTVITTIIVLSATLATSLNSPLISKTNFTKVNTQNNQTNNEYQNIIVDGVDSYLYTTKPEDLKFTQEGILSGYSETFKTKMESGTQSLNLYINLEIPTNITSITTSAFSNMSALNPSTNYQLISIDFSKAKSLTKIMDFAFSTNRDLRHVYFNDSLSNLGKNAFINCSKLTKLEGISKTKLTTIEDFTFKATKLSEVSLPSSIVTIKREAFSNIQTTSALLDLSSTKLTTIGSGAFKNSTFGFYYLPNTVTSIGNLAFENAILPVTSENINFPSNLINKATFETSGILTPNGNSSIWDPSLFEQKWELKSIFDKTKIENYFFNQLNGKTTEDVIKEFTNSKGSQKGQLINEIFKFNNASNQIVNIYKPLRNFTVTLEQNKSITLKIEVSALYKTDILEFNVLDPRITNPNDNTDQTSPPTNPNETTPSKPESKPITNKDLIIVGVSVGVIALIIILITTISLIIKKRKKG